MSVWFGILYVATGPSCLAEAARSASSAQAHMPDVPRAIFTDNPTAVPSVLFDYVFHVATATHSSYDKIRALSKTPFERTLFLDSDTLVLAPVYELSELLEPFELAYCHAPMRFEEGDFPGCNEAFPQGNSGVLLYRNSHRVRSLFLAWDQRYRTQIQNFRVDGSTRRMLDQPSFRQTLYSSDIRFTILPPKIDGVDYLIMKESDIMGVLDQSVTRKKAA
jgi:hypothetical protein